MPRGKKEPAAPRWRHDLHDPTSRPTNWAHPDNQNPGRRNQDLPNWKSAKPQKIVLAGHAGNRHRHS